MLSRNLRTCQTATTALPISRQRSLVACLAILGTLACTATADAQSRYGKKPLAPETRDKIDGVIDNIVEPEAVLKVPKRQSKIVRTTVDIHRVSVADQGVIEIVAFDTREIEIIGKETGSTSMTLWLGEGPQAQTLSILVKVEADKMVDEQRRLEYGELQDMINEMYPGSKIRIFPVADKVVVKGQARDGEEAQRILSIVRQNGGMGGGGFGGGFGGGYGGGGITAQGTAAQPFPDGSILPASTVISMLMIPGEQQVMLKVRLAELSRNTVRSMGVNMDATIYDFFMRSTFGGAGGSLFYNGTFSEGDFNLAINALEKHGYMKILAQPNLVTLSGRPASFLAGGEFAVPTIVGLDGVGAATTQFRGFGAQLSFTPTILDKDRIRLQVNPEFSSLNGSSVNGIPGLDTRSASTTVDLREGQVLAIAGLIQDTQSGNVAQLPYLGSMPIIGPLFANKSVARNETELIIIVTPEIVSSIDPKDAPALLPGMEVTEVMDFDFYFRNQIEGRPNDNYRSTVWPKYRDILVHPKMNVPSYQKAQGYYMNGPTGLSF